MGVKLIRTFVSLALVAASAGVFVLTVARKPSVPAKSCCPAHDKAGLPHDGRDCPMMKANGITVHDFPSPAPFSESDQSSGQGCEIVSVVLASFGL